MESPQQLGTVYEKETAKRTELFSTFVRKDLSHKMGDTMITPLLDSLYALFPENSDRPRTETLSAEELPSPYQQLLAHTHHMTVTVEEFYGEPVDVVVLDVVRHGDRYARKILLKLKNKPTVVQFGIVQIHLAMLPPDVRVEIEAEHTPLGRVLIQHDVLRTVNPAGYFSAWPSPAMCQWFGLTEPTLTYGRVGMITANGQPAIHVAEILAPVN
jgi:chorismate-pyruvate lyase